MKPQQLLVTEPMDYARWLITITTFPPISGSRAQSKVSPAGDQGKQGHDRVKLKFHMGCIKTSPMNNYVEYK